TIARRGKHPLLKSAAPPSARAREEEMPDFVIRQWPRPAETVYTLDKLEQAVDCLRELMLAALRTPSTACRHDRIQQSLRGHAGAHTALVTMEFTGNRFPARDPSK